MTWEKSFYVKYYNNIMKCKYCQSEMSDEQAMSGGHPECLDQRDIRRKNEQCIKCGRSVDGGVVFHDGCAAYTGYVLKH